MDQSNSILVCHYLIPYTVCFQQWLQIWGDVLQTQIVDICIDFYPYNFIWSVLLLLYHILVKFHPVYHITKYQDVSFVQKIRVFYSVLSNGFDCFNYCRMLHLLCCFRPHSTLVFTDYV